MQKAIQEDKQIVDSMKGAEQTEDKVARLERLEKQPAVKTGIVS